MKLVRFETPSGRISWGWLDPNDASLVHEPLGGLAAAPLDHRLAAGIAGLVADARMADRTTHEVAALRLLAPLAKPSKFMAIGRNYRAHAAELGNQAPEQPMVFGIMPSAISGPFDDIALPPASAQVDWEGELGVVIGRTARNVPRANAIDYIAGYTAINDVSARDLQKKDVQWTRAKSFDTFKPMGPCLTTVDELGLAEDLNLTVKVNGRQKQNASTAMMIFQVAELIEFISAFCTLQPGDIIATGTPSGVGMGENPVSFLKHGDIVETEIAGIGRMANRVVGTSSADIATGEVSLVRA